MNAEPTDELSGLEPVRTEPVQPRRAPASIVPASGIESRALFFVVAIMAFLASVTVGAVTAIGFASAEWQADIASEITVQIKPDEGVDLDVETRKAVEFLSGQPGIVSAKAVSDREMRDLLEPWLGAGADIGELPVPRLIIIEIDRANPPDLSALSTLLGEAAKGASLDDHQLWQRRLKVMARTMIAGGLIILGLVLAATVLSIVFATRGAMASNRAIVEVLHLVGAREPFIARQFERHFLRLGLKGGVAGGLAALIGFLILQWIAVQFSATPAGDQIDALFGAFAIGWAGYTGVVLTVLVISLLTAITSRLTVYRFLKVFD